MPKTDPEFHSGHRSRLKQKLLDGKLTGYELLELLLTYAIPRRDVRPLAHSLVKKFGSVYSVLHASFDELISVSGIGHGAATIIKLANELISVSYKERAEAGTYLADDKFIRDYCRNLVAGKPVEEFHVLYLGNDRRLLFDEIHSHGTINQSAVYPREISRKALQLNAISVILVHNHPVSENNFSSEDTAITSIIEACLNSFSISLIDHFLVTSNGIVHSLRASPWLNKSSFKSI